MATPTEITKTEILDFLKGEEPGILCVTGQWGVGKTYLWRRALDELRASKKLILTRYSYVSLFGLNSLDDVKLALFENLEWLDQGPSVFGQRGKAGFRAIAARSKKLHELAGGLPYIGSLLSKMRPLYFSAIQNQIVCIDDLDRRSDKLQIKEILGLVSFLREHRGCKVAILLNSEKLDGKEQFESLLQKVIEAKVHLAPTPSESAKIALNSNDWVSEEIAARCDILGICNIRIIKQVERLVRRVDNILGQFPQPVRKQAIQSLVLFGWAKYDRECSPTLEFLRTDSIQRQISRENGKSVPAEEASWESLLLKYDYSHSDEFDLVLLNYVDTFIFDAEAILIQARAQQEQQRLSELHGSLEEAWRAYHASFDDNEAEVVCDIVTGMKKSYEVASLRSLNSAVSLLKRLGKNAEATDLLAFFSDKYVDLKYWSSQGYPFESPLDPDLSALIVEKKGSVGKEEFDIVTALIGAVKSCNAETLAKLANASVHDYYDVIHSARGEEKERLILSALEFRRIVNSTDDMKKVVVLMEDALRMVARKSTLNALRVAKYGVNLD